jgi:adenylate cyclase
VDRFTEELPLKRETATILFADVVESVRLVQIDERRMVNRMRSLLAKVSRDIAPALGGTTIERVGDGLLLRFESPRQALACAACMHEAANESNSEEPEDCRLFLRVGVHRALVLTDDWAFYGAGVSIAARIAALAAAAETIASASVRDELIDDIDAQFFDLGECYLKHVDKPVRLYRIEARNAHHIPTVTGSEALKLQPTIAVLPFAWVDQDGSEQAYTADIFAEELIARLTAQAGVTVVSRLSTTLLSGHPAAQDIADKALNANYIFSGRCFHMGGRIHLFAQLMETKSQSVIWSISKKLEANKKWCVDDDLIGECSTAIVQSLVVSEQSRVQGQPMPSVASYGLLIGAVTLMHRTAVSDFKLAHEALTELVNRHPRVARPHAWMANWHALCVTQGLTADRDRDCAQALQSAARALDTEPNCSLALTIDGVLQASLKKDFGTALQRLDAAVAVNPNESLAWLFMGGVNAFMGNGVLAIELCERAISLSPLDPLKFYYEVFLATSLMSEGLYERATCVAEQSINRNSTHASTYRILAIARALSGDLPGARLAVSQLRRVSPHETVEQFRRQSPYSAGPRGDAFAHALESAGLPVK